MAPSAPTGLVSFPPVLSENRYQSQLYAELAPHGFRVVPGELKVRWLVANRRRARILHFHWPQEYYRHKPMPRGPASWAKLTLFGVRLAAARVLGYRIAWTVHEVYPLQTASHRLDVVGTALLARFSHVLMANDKETAQQATLVLGSPAAKTEVVPHSSYTGVYPAGRARAEVRAELGIADDSVVYLLFGHVSVYKRIEWFVDAFRDADLEDAVLVVAGLPMDEDAAEHVRRAAGVDARVKPLLEFIADDAVSELYGAADVALCPRQDGGTSAVLILALSMGVPAVTARTPNYEELTDGERAAWLFEPHDSQSLIDALARAAEDADERRARGAAGLEQVRGLSWEAMGRRTAELLQETMPSAEAPPQAAPGRA
jgi:beta-1,4-mannosyltransferase